jgi:outer membrane protein
MMWGAESPRPVSALTLQEAVDQTLARSPAIRGVEAQKETASAGLRQARAASGPSLQASVDATRGDDPVYVFGSLLRQRTFGPSNFAVDSLNRPGDLTNVRSALEVGMPIFTGFELSSLRKIGALGLERAEAAGEAARQELRFSVVDVYLRAVMLGEDLSVLDERLASAADALESARRLKTKGLVLESDFYAAEALEAGLRARRAQLIHNRESALAVLSNLTGVDVSSATLTGVLKSADYGISGIGSAVRPDVRAAFLGAEAAKASAVRAKRSALPTVGAFAAVESDTKDFSSNPSNHIIGVRASAILWDPARGARARRAEAESAAARAEADRAAQSARIESLQALAAYRGAAETVPLLTETRDRMAQALKLFRPLYREGRQSILEVLRAEAALADAEASLREGLYGLHAGFAGVKMAAGELDEAAVKDIQNRLEVAP